MSQSVKRPIQIRQSILAHPWYQRWEMGEVSHAALIHYASEYYWQVSRFPRYLSALHSQLEDLGDRQVILANLSDEENPEEPHPELWLDFAEALGADRRQIRQSMPGAAARALVGEFQSLVTSSPEEGLGAILAYESQVPEVARFKEQALKAYYLSPERQALGTRFFSVHQSADPWHTEELEALVKKLPEEKRQKAQQAADRACGALWRFLDAMPN